jgi:hypothetical protein
LKLWYIKTRLSSKKEKSLKLMATSLFEIFTVNTLSLHIINNAR